MKKSLIILLNIILWNNCSNNLKCADFGCVLQMDGMKQQPNTSEGMLANFFNSLLNKKTGVASTGVPRAGIALMI